MPRPNFGVVPDSQKTEAIMQSRLKIAIEKAGGTAEISRKSGIATSTINDYLTGREPRFSRILVIARACEVSLDWLAGGDYSGMPADKFSDIELLSDQLLNDVAHFWGLHMTIRMAREWFENSEIRPTLKDVLVWIGPVYRSALPLPDRPLEFEKPSTNNPETKTEESA